MASEQVLSGNRDPVPLWALEVPAQGMPGLGQEKFMIVAASIKVF